MRIPVFFLSLMILLSACSTIRVVYDYDVQADFSSYKNFRWAVKTDKKNGAAFNNILLEKRLKYAIESELEAKDFHEDIENADFILAYEQYSRIERDYYIYQSPAGWHRWDWNQQRIWVEKRREGLILLKIYDAETDELVWQSWASGIEINMSIIDQIINETAKKLVEYFPPPKT